MLLCWLNTLNLFNAIAIHPVRVVIIALRYLIVYRQLLNVMSLFFCMIIMCFCLLIDKTITTKPHPLPAQYSDAHVCKGTIKGLNLVHTFLLMYSAFVLLKIPRIELELCHPYIGDPDLINIQYDILYIFPSLDCHMLFILYLLQYIYYNLIHLLFWAMTFNVTVNVHSIVPHDVFHGLIYFTV